MVHVSQMTIGLLQVNSRSSAILDFSFSLQIILLALCLLMHEAFGDLDLVYTQFSLRSSPITASLLQFLDSI